MKIIQYAFLLFLGFTPLGASQAVQQRLTQATACELQALPKKVEKSFWGKVSACWSGSTQTNEQAKIDHERIERFNEHQTFIQALTDLTNLPPEIIAIVALYNQATFFIGGFVKSALCSVEVLSPERIAVGLTNGSIVLVDSTEGKIVQTLPGHKAPVHGLCYLYDRQELLSLSTLDGSKVSDLCRTTINGIQGVSAEAMEQEKKENEQDDLLRVWSPYADTTSQSVLERRDALSLTQGYIPNSQCKDETETKTQAEVVELRRNGNEVGVVRERSWVPAISTSTIPTRGYGQASDSIRFWFFDKKKIFSKGEGTSLPVTATDGQIFIGWSTGDVLVLNEKQNIPITYLHGHTAPVRVLDFLDKDNKRYLLSGSDDGTIRVWDCDSKRELQRFIGHTAPICALKISFFFKDAPYLLSVSADGTVRKWSLDI